MGVEPATEDAAGVARVPIIRVDEVVRLGPDWMPKSIDQRLTTSSTTSS